MPRETDGKMGARGSPPRPASPPSSRPPARSGGPSQPPARSGSPSQPPARAQPSKPAAKGKAGEAFAGAAAGAAVGTIVGGALTGPGTGSGPGVGASAGPLYYGRCADYFVGLLNCADSHGGDLDLCRDILRDLSRCSASTD